MKRPLSQGPRRRARKPVTPSPSLGGRVRKYFDYRGHLQRGDSLAISSVPDSIWDFGSKYVFEGDYWGSPCQVAGRLECIVMGKGGKHAQVLLRGTDHPELKAWAESTITSGNPAEVSIHLCPANWESRGVATSRPGGNRRSRSRPKEDSRKRSPRREARGSHPTRKRSRGSEEHENRVPLFRRNPLGFKAQCAKNPQSKKDQETWEEEKVQGAEASQEHQQQQLQRRLSMQQREQWEQWGEHRFSRLRSPLQRGT